MPVPDSRRRFLLQITLGRVTLTIPYLAKDIGLLYLYLVGLMVIVWVSYTRTRSFRYAVNALHVFFT